MNKVYSIRGIENDGDMRVLSQDLFSSPEKALNAHNTEFTNEVLKQIHITTDKGRNSKVEKMGTFDEDGKLHSLLIDTTKYDFDLVMTNFENQQNNQYDWVWIIEIDVL